VSCTSVNVCSGSTANWVIKCSNFSIVSIREPKVSSSKSNLLEVVFKNKKPKKGKKKRKKQRKRKYT